MILKKKKTSKIQERKAPGICQKKKEKKKKEETPQKTHTFY